MKKLLILVPALCMAAFAADVNGNWTGTIEVNDTGSGTKVSTPVRVQLEQRGDALNGKIGRAEDPDPVTIRNGRIEGNKVTFEASSAETAGPMKFALQVDADRMEGEMNGAIDEGKISGHVKLSRERNATSSH